NPPWTKRSSTGPRSWATWPSSSPGPTSSWPTGPPRSWTTWPTRSTAATSSGATDAAQSSLLRGYPGSDRLLEPETGVAFHDERQHRDHPGGDEGDHPSQAPPHPRPQVEDRHQVDHIDPPVHEGDPVAEHRRGAAVGQHTVELQGVLEEHLQHQQQQEGSGDERHHAIAGEGTPVPGLGQRGSVLLAAVPMGGIGRGRWWLLGIAVCRVSG